MLLIQNIKNIFFKKNDTKEIHILNDPSTMKDALPLVNKSILVKIDKKKKDNIWQKVL